MQESLRIWEKIVNGKFWVGLGYLFHQSDQYLYLYECLSVYLRLKSKKPDWQINFVYIRQEHTYLGYHKTHGLCIESRCDTWSQHEEERKEEDFWKDNRGFIKTVHRVFRSTTGLELILIFIFGTFHLFGNSAWKRTTLRRRRTRKTPEKYF